MALGQDLQLTKLKFLQWWCLVWMMRALILGFGEKHLGVKMQGNGFELVSAVKTVTGTSTSQNRKV